MMHVIINESTNKTKTVTVRWPDKQAEPFGLSLNFLFLFVWRQKGSKENINNVFYQLEH
jgi:hypothetical protein